MYSGLCGLAGLGLTVLALWPTVILTHGSDKSAPLRQLAPPLYLQCPARGCLMISGAPIADGN